MPASRWRADDGAHRPAPQLAHGRTGDKGNRSNISVIAHRPEDFVLLAAQVTEERVAALFAHRRPSNVKRYLLPKIAAMNFVIDDVLDGGVNGSLNLDTHGKASPSCCWTFPSPWRRNEHP
jgi:hypothetical protein